MIVNSIEKVDDCLEANKVYDFILNITINEDLIKYCGNIGKLIYKKEFEKPYFKVIVKGKYTFKGAEGNHIIRVLFPDDTEEKEHIDKLESFLNKFVR